MKRAISEALFDISKDKGTPNRCFSWRYGPLYIGANGGWGSSRKCFEASPAGGSVLQSFVLTTGDEGTMRPERSRGRQIGYRWQVSSLVFGLEAPRRLGHSSWLKD